MPFDVRVEERGQITRGIGDPRFGQLQPCQVVVSAVSRGQARTVRLDRFASLEQRAQPDALSPHEEPDRARHDLFARLLHERSAGAARLDADEALHFEDPQRFTHGRAAHPGLCDQFTFGRKPRSGREIAVEDAFAQLVGEDVRGLRNLHR